MRIAAIGTDARAWGSALLLVSSTACGPGAPVGGSVAAPSVPPAGWTAAVLVGDGGRVLEDAYGGCYPPPVALGTGPHGAIAVWIRRDPHAVLASRLSGSNWEAPSAVSSGAARDLDDPSIGVDSGGNAVVVWGEWPESGAEWRTHASRYDSRGGWGRPQPIQPVPSAVYATRGRGFVVPLEPKVVVDPTGHALAFWDQSDAAHPGQYPHALPESLSASRFSMATGWSAAESLSREFESGGAARAAAAGNGSAFVVWSDEGVWVARFDANDGWGASRLLAPFPAASADVAADGSGNALTAWVADSWQHRSIVAQRFQAGRGWAEPEEVWAGGASGLRLAMNASGQAVMAWIDHTTESMWASRYAPDEGWGEAQLVGERGPELDVALDAEGNAFVVWRAPRDPSPGPQSPRIRAARFHTRTGWSDARTLAQLESSGSGFSFPRIVADVRGDAVAAWSQYEGSRASVWACRYVAPGR